MQPDTVPSTVVVEDHPAKRRGAFWWLPYVYLLRTQIVTAIVLVGLPLVGRSSPLLNGLFDLDYDSPGRSFLGMTLVSLAAFSTALTLLASSWCTIYNAPNRYGVARIAVVAFPSSGPSVRPLACSRCRRSV